MRESYQRTSLRLIVAIITFGIGVVAASAWFITISVSIGDKHKVIKTRSEGDVPIQLWGIYYAIEGAATNVKWELAP